LAEYAIERDLVEVVLAGEVDDRPDRHPRRLQVEYQLAEAAVTVVFGRCSAHERDREMRLVRIARPHLGAGDLVAALDCHRTSADRGEVGPRIRLAHPDTEKDLAARNPRQKREALLLGAIA